LANPNDDGIDKAELKKLLARSKKEPVNCAVAISKAQQALIMLHKVKQPRALVKELEKAHGELKNPRWGSAFVDVDDNPKLVILTLNKSSPGLARKMKTTLKGTGFSRVRVMLEDGSVDEAVEEDDEEQSEDGYKTAAATSDDADDPNLDTDGPVADPPGVDPSNAAPVSAEPSTVEPSSANSSNDDPSMADPSKADGQQPATMDATAPKAEQSPVDAAALTGRLTGLVKQMMGVIAKDPTQKAALIELATDAQACLKRGDVDQASATIDVLEQAMGSAGATASPGAMPASPPPTPAAGPANGTADNGAADNGVADNVVRPIDTPAGKQHVKARQAWLATRTKMTKDLDQLSQAFGSAFQGHGKAGDLQAAFQKRLDSVLGSLDEELAHKLDEVRQAEDAVTHARIAEEAKRIIVRYQSVVTSDPTIAAIDQNPFVPMSLGKTLNTTLSTLAKVL
jgi:hypothetical protein